MWLVVFGVLVLGLIAFAWKPEADSYRRRKGERRE